MTYPISKIPRHISEDHQSRILNFSIFNMDDDVFFDFCQDNKHLRIERNADGTIIIMPPTGTLTGEKNSEIAVDLGLWKRLPFVLLMLLGCLTKDMRVLNMLN
jgi:hypothetical protein